MLRHFRHYLVRHDPLGHWRHHLKASVSAVLGISVVGGLAAWSGLPLLVASLGPTALGLSAHPDSASSQPINIFGGYFIGAALASGAHLVLPGSWWGATLAVGLVMLIMLVARVNHPPAAALPLSVFASPMPVQTLFEVLLAGCLCLVGVGLVMHRIPPQAPYPRRPEPAAE